MNAFSPAPEFDGRAENFASYRQEAELWLLVTHLPLNRRAPALALAMGKMPRELCLSLGAAALHCEAGVETIMELSQKNLAPDASDAGFRGIVGPILRWNGFTCIPRQCPWGRANANPPRRPLSPPCTPKGLAEDRTDTDHPPHKRGAIRRWGTLDVSPKNPARGTKPSGPSRLSDFLRARNVVAPSHSL